MKKLLLAAAVSISVSSITHAESAFNYNMLQLSYTNTTIGIDDTDMEFSGQSYELFLSKELENQLFFYGNAVAGVIDDSVTEDNVRINADVTASGFAVGVGRYFILNEKADAYLRGGISYSTYDLEMTGTNTSNNATVSVEEDDSDTSVDLELGARLHLDKANQFELSPYIEMSSQNGDTYKGVGARLGFNVSPQIQLQGMFSTSIDDDIDDIGVAIRIYM